METNEKDIFKFIDIQDKRRTSDKIIAINTCNFNNFVFTL